MSTDIVPSPTVEDILPRDTRILMKDFCKVYPFEDPAPWEMGDIVIVHSNGVVVVMDREDNSHTFGAIGSNGFTREQAIPK